VAGRGVRAAAGANPVISVLMSANVEPDLQTSLAAFVRALEQLGWTEGRNVRIEIRWADGDARQIRGYAAELAVLAPDVILVNGVAAIGPLLEATRTLPIVFCGVPDPVGAGFVDSLPWRLLGRRSPPCAGRCRWSHP
jgi:putative ABC transport system substrate-binding protein